MGKIEDYHDKLEMLTKFFAKPQKQQEENKDDKKDKK